MKRIIIITFLIGSLFVITGCNLKKQTIVYRKDNIEIKIKIKKKLKYKISEDLKDFKSSREDAMILTDDLNIGIDFSEELSNSNYQGDFKKLMKEHQEEKQFKEITINGINGFERYSISYMRYEVYLPIKNDKEKNIIINIYLPEKDEKSIHKKYQSKEIQEIVNSITIKTKKKK